MVEEGRQVEKGNQVEEAEKKEGEEGKQKEEDFAEVRRTGKVVETEQRCL